MNLVIIQGKIMNNIFLQTKINEKDGEKQVVEFLTNTVFSWNKAKNQGSNYVPIIAFNHTAKYIANNYKLGDEIWFKGYFKSNSYEKNGVKKYTYTIVVDDVYQSYNSFSNLEEETKSEPILGRSKEMIENLTQEDFFSE
ncbi:single-stranded DNA-binding protein [Mycoplasmopsis agassizii]|uniref:Single-stranded DNA-binding protein n=1 Tax=Mycoplasmopsis agassizii TaxID=33922 RepID=A0ABX4H641_9BACT|nr:single-stranded DNA-binding protein [Mycoplasmopsis agassizii]PAF55371.1 hypothetical protein CJF60_01625 [Mycoplasmopsis agassizii]SMC20454.1 Single-strand binding protein family protein [Mycoplasmopsis agassizii]